MRVHETTPNFSLDNKNQQLLPKGMTEIRATLGLK